MKDFKCTTPKIIASYKIFYLLFVACSIFYELCPFYQSEAASVPPTNTTASQGKGGMSRGVIVAIVVPISVVVLIFIGGFCYFNKRTRKKYDSDSEGILKDRQTGIGISNVNLLQYDFRTIEAATNKFSADSKIGNGGSGEVYRGRLANGQEIAVKRLSPAYPQGVEVFKNEVGVLARVQHRNLVRLLGFCVQREGKIIVYEHVTGNNLAYVLFDPEKKRQLDWPNRHKIVKGIVRGIQYLYEDSRLRIVDRDLKPHNVLLDSDMNPKIADFGLATIFRFDQTQENDFLLAGTPGYMALEQLHQDNLSLKCDVYSFGVLLMMIISGRRLNQREEDEDEEENILSHAWRLWENGEALELLDPTIRESYNPKEVMRSIHIALLCVQPNPEDRPSMSSILIMLESYTLTLPSPSNPLNYDGEDDFSISSVESE